MNGTTLVLVPTALELGRIQDLGGIAPELGHVRLLGFGPVAAAARAALLFRDERPRRALLVGIAGAFCAKTHPVGTALCFDAVALHGVGAGEGSAFLGPPALGFPQWPATDTQRAIEDRLELCSAGEHRAELLLTTTAASATPEQAAEHLRRFPAARAEDMEGFGCALAAALSGVPLAIVRGISNQVGDRDPSRWNIPLALSAARQLAIDLLGRDDWSAAP